MNVSIEMAQRWLNQVAAIERLIEDHWRAKGCTSSTLELAREHARHVASDLHRAITAERTVAP